MIYILSHKTQINPNQLLKMLQLITFCKKNLVGDNIVLGLERTDSTEMKMLFLDHVSSHVTN